MHFYNNRASTLGRRKGGMFLHYQECLFGYLGIVVCQYVPGRKSSSYSSSVRGLRNVISGTASSSSAMFRSVALLLRSDRVIIIILSPAAKQVFKWLGQAVEKPAAIIIFLLGLVSFARLHASCHVASRRVHSGVCCFCSGLVVVVVAGSIRIAVARCGRSLSKAFFTHRKIAALCKVRCSLSFIFDE